MKIVGATEVLKIGDGGEGGVGRSDYEQIYFGNMEAGTNLWI